MISLVLAMVWTRRGQAVTLALLALLAVASAVAAPAYLIAAERAVAAGQIATAPNNELSMVVSRIADPRMDGEAGSGITFPDAGQVLLDLPGFTYHHSAEMAAVGLEETLDFPTRLVFRQEICAHVRLVSGRCLEGEGEVLLGERTAQRRGLVPGDPVELSAAEQNNESNPPTWMSVTAPKPLTVVGTYRVADSTGAYWGQHGYFVSGAGVSSGEPAFTNAVTLGEMERVATVLTIDGVARPGTIDIERLGELRADLTRIDGTAQELERIQFTSGIPRLLDRIDEGRAAARLLVPVLAVPLVLLACFTIYLTVGYGAEGRQSELAVVALRGARWWTRWWLATGESLVAVLAGAVAGSLAGQLLVNAVSAALFPGVGAEPAVSSLRYAPLAAVAALIAAVVAQRRQLVSPVTRLLRRSPARDHRRLAATEAVVAALAVATGAQFALAEDPLTGAGLFAPAFIVLALALVAARLLLPLVNLLAVRALHRGHLGLALAGLQLSRRPGAGRLFALLVATAAIAGYAVGAVDTAAQGREVAARLGTGADRVVTVQPLTRHDLLRAVRALDPGGTFAMAVVRLPGGSVSVPGLAFDSGRLAAVAAWPDGATGPRTVQRLLRPAAAEPPALATRDILIDATTTTAGEMRMVVSVSSVAGHGDALVEMGYLKNGRHRYLQRTDVCRDGCRINGIRFSGAGGASTTTGQVILHQLNTTVPAPLTEPARWRAAGEGRLAAAPDGLRADVEVTASVAEVVWIQPVVTPYPMPMAYAGTLPADPLITGVAPAGVPLAGAVALPVIPAAGGQSALVDLEYLDRLAVDPKPVIDPEVWLGPAAPADVTERMAAHGLVTVVGTSTAEVRAGLDEQGPAVAVWFHLLAAVLAALLGAGALALTVAVDRVRRTEDLTALRVQGLRPGPAGRATRWTYPVLVVIATAVGMLVAALTWQLTGWALPLAGLNPPDVPLPAWPGPLPLLAATGAVLAVEAVVALLGGRDLRHRIENR
ncbi:MAG TPA: FtsX-like permease family protein [Actinoplanes sp.]|nr:FtsX-like permease family protein [Actinoplanes sp.]